MEKEKDKRRSFLKHILAGSAVAVGTAAVIKPARAKSFETVRETDDVLYTESASFSKYYKSLRS